MKKVSYGEMHRPHKQKNIDDIPINPTLPPDFYCTPYSNRNPLEKKDWWCRPFIVSTTWKQKEPSIINQIRLEQNSPSLDEVSMTELKARKNRWYAAFSEGTQYTVFCLDKKFSHGPTIRGITASLGAAIDVAKHPRPPSRITQLDYDCAENLLERSRLWTAGHFATVDARLVKAQYPCFL